MEEDWRTELMELSLACVSWDTGKIDYGEWETALLRALSCFAEKPTEADMEWAIGVAKTLNLP